MIIIIVYTVLPIYCITHVLHYPYTAPMVTDNDYHYRFIFNTFLTINET